MPRIDADTVEEHREALRRRVFAAFADLMAEHSFDAISMAQIAARAEVGRTAIYHHFPDKEAVLVAFATHETGRYLVALQEQLVGADSPADALRLYIRHHLASGEQFHMGLGRQMSGVVSPASRTAIREHVLAVEAVLRQIIADGVAQGAFVVDDVDTTLLLMHSCLSPRDLDQTTVERFLLRAVSS
jgi:AcrR family transcriptional regulator